jgi:hypothetical protein
MLSALYTIASWAIYVAGGLALIAALAIVVRLRKQPRKPVLAPSIALVISAALCLGMFAFLRTRMTQIRLSSIQQVGLEARHAGLRTNALIYRTQVSIPVTFSLLPSYFPGSGIIDKVSGFLVHHTTTTDAQVAVYGLIDFSTVQDKVATVDRRARTITLSLPNPTVNRNTTYIWSVGGVQEREGPLNAIARSITGPIDSLLGRPVVSVDPTAALARAEAAALSRAQHSRALDSCGKQEIVRQLTAAVNLTPAYRGYTVRVRWPTPVAANVNCAALQAQLTRGGSGQHPVNPAHHV